MVTLDPMKAIKTLTWWPVLIWLALFVVPAPAQDSIRCHEEALIASLPLESGLTKVSKHGDMLCGRSGDNIAFVDVSDPVQPFIRALFPIVGAVDVVRHEDILLVVNSSGLHIFDASDLDDIEWRATYTNGASPRNVAARGDFAFLTNGLFIFSIDISDPANPVARGFYSQTGKVFGSMSSQGDLLLVRANSNEVQVLDASDPLNLTLHSTLPVAGAVGFAMEEDQLAIASRDGVSLYSLAVPSSPDLVWNVEPEGNEDGIGVEFDSGFLFASYTDGIVRAFELGLPGSPPIRSDIRRPDAIGGIVHAGNHFLIATVAGLETWKVRLPTADAVIDTFSFSQVGVTEFWGRNIVVRDHVVYVAAGRNGFRVFDLSDPADIRQIESVYSQTRRFRNVSVVDNRAFVSDDFYSFYMYDISDPSDLAGLGSFNYAVELKNYSDPRDIEARGDIAYVAIGPVAVMDVGKRPFELLRYLPTGATARELEIEGDVLFAATGTQSDGGGSSGGGGLVAYDITVPDFPVQVGWIGVPSASKDLLVRDGIAYMTSGNGVQIVDVTDPSSMILLDYIPVSDPARNLDLRGDELFIAVDGWSYEDEIQVWDVADPSTAKFRHRFQPPKGAIAVAALNDNVLLGKDFDGSLSTIHLGPCPACVADANRDGSADFFDLLLFLNWYSLGDPRADWNDDSALDFFDLLQFLSDYSTSCG